MEAVSTFLSSCAHAHDPDETWRSITSEIGIALLAPLSVASNWMLRMRAA
jgi:hypothetical protein